MAKKKASIDKIKQHDENGLSYPHLSIVFIQTFTVGNDGSGFKFDKSGYPYSLHVSIEDIDSNVSSSIWTIDHLHGENNFYRHYELTGFDFKFDLPFSHHDYNSFIHLHGKCKIKVAIFFERTVSITYRFVFDNNSCFTDRAFNTESVIRFLSEYLLNTHFQQPLEEDDFDEKYFCKLYNLPINQWGENAQNEKFSTYYDVIDHIALRYKRHVLLTMFRPGREFMDFGDRSLAESISTAKDQKYALVDIWDDVVHPLPDGSDLFSKAQYGLNETEVFNHLKDSHKKELIGLMTTFENWKERSEDIFYTACGEDVSSGAYSYALVGDNVSVLFNLNHRAMESNDQYGFLDHLNDDINKRKYGLSWPQYLLILQFLLAKKSIIQHASRVILNNTVRQTGDNKISQLLKKNQDINFRMAKSMLQYDAVQYVYNPDIKLVERISNRLEVDKERHFFEHNMEIIDKSLRNIKDEISSSREISMNIILGIVSVISAFQLFFVGTRMPFLNDFWHIESGTIGALIITIVAAISIFIILIAIWSAFRSFFSNLSNKKE